MPKIDLLVHDMSCRGKIGSDRKFAYWVDGADDEEDTDRGIANTHQGLS